MGSAAATDATGEKITPDDIEEKVREIFEGARDEVSSTRSQLTTVLGLVAIAVVLLSFLLGRRAGKKNTTVVEIRRV